VPSDTRPQSDPGDPSSRPPLPASGSPSPASGPRPRASDAPPPATGPRPPASDAPPPASGSRPPASDAPPPASGFRLPASGQQQLASFRAKTKRLAIHPLEKAALWVITAHLIFLPWALGTMHPWSQVISCGLSVIGFMLALIPRNYTEEHTGSAPFRLLMYPKLLRFPIFWTGLLLLGLVVCQALNPAWEYRSDGRVFWMQAVPHHDWLPQGVTAPFEKWNQWRMLVIYSSALLTACSLWVAFTRRRTVQYFLTTLAFNGLLLALLGITQRVLNTGKIFGLLDFPGAVPFATFVYKNHGAEYLNLVLAVTCGLAGWYYLRGIRRMEKSNPSGVLAFFATCIAVGIVTSYARGATLIMMVFLFSAIAAFIIHQIRLPREARHPVVMVMLILVFGYFLKTGFEAVRAGQAWDRMEEGLARKDTSLESRERATKASMEMLEEHWKTGVGAGSFRFLFPIYQHHYPALIRWPNGRPMYWEHAHNDVVQLPIELGAAGMVLVVVASAFWGISLLRGYFWQNPLSACIVLGLFLLVVHSWWDFPFQCSAILITWSSLWPIATMWARFEESGARGGG